MARRAAFALALAALLGGCAHETAADRAPRPDPAARLTPAGPTPWQEDFGDPALRDLLQRADRGALDIKIALARLERADADVALARSGARPTVNLGVAGASGGRELSSHREVGAPTLEAIYEVDLSGRIARLREAAGAERMASAADVTAARLLVAAETTRAYVALCAANEALAAAGRRHDLAERSVTLAHARRAEGYATAQDENAANDAADAAIQLARTARIEAGEAASRLRTLTGGAEIPLACAGGPPVLSPPPQALPAELVDRRPETQAAFARLKAADDRRAAAVAAERPQFQLSAVLGAPDAAIVTLLDTRALAWALAGRIGGGVLDGGGARSRIRAATSDADLADLAYRKAVLEGWADLRDGAVAEAAAGETAAAAEQAVVRAEAGLRAVQARRVEGAADGVAMAQAQIRLEDARDALRLARVQAAGARVRRLLSGGGR
jgi:outer membrane protein TolC